MTDKVILLAAGHGMRPDGTMDNGAYNPNTHTKEHDLNLKVVTYAAHHLNKYVCQVIEDINLLGPAHEPNWKGLMTELKRRNLKPDLVVEVHHDSYNAGKGGFGILPRTIFKTKITQLASNISIFYTKERLPTKPSYTDVRGLGLLKSLSYPTIIWECANTIDVSEDILNKRGRAIAMGIVLLFGLAPDV